MNIRAFFAAMLLSFLPVYGFAQSSAPLNNIRILRPEVFCVEKAFLDEIHPGFDIPVSVGLAPTAIGVVKVVTVAKNTGEFMILMIRPDGFHCIAIIGKGGIISSELEILPGQIN